LEGKSTVEMLLKNGCNIELYPGGLDEMIQPAGNHKTINIKTRKGFQCLLRRHECICSSRIFSEPPHLTFIFLIFLIFLISDLHI